MNSGQARDAWDQIQRNALQTAMRTNAVRGAPEAVAGSKPAAPIKRKACNRGPFFVLYSPSACGLRSVVVSSGEPA